MALQQREEDDPYREYVCFFVVGTVEASHFRGGEQQIGGDLLDMRVFGATGSAIQQSDPVVVGV